MATSLAAVAIYLASVMPTLKLALCFIASVTVCTVAVKYNKVTALFVWLASSAVALIIAADKSIASSYLLFFGSYPVIKAGIENGKSIVSEWILKIAVFFAYAFAAYGICKLFFPSLLDFKYSLALVFIVAFASLFDVALSLVITEIKRRFSSLLK